MSRTLGGGRVLGNSRSLNPATVLPQRRSSRLSPSESTTTLGSQASTSQVSSTEHEPDLSSRISRDHDGVSISDEAPSTKLACPICNEDMLTLLQLNRHLDDNHQHLEAVEQDEVKTWFKKQMVRAKRFQPLVALNQKLKGLDVFEPNGAPRLPGSTLNASSTSDVSPPDLDEVVTRTHWQRPTSNDRCLEPMCGKPLGAINGCINCRNCGRLFCEEHTMYQMRLSRSAQHEPVRGFWCRVCETCYKSREGYNDQNGSSRDHTDSFMAARRKMVDTRYLEISRLEKRLTKLTQILAASVAKQGTGNGGLPWPLTGQKNQRKALEQSVVSWEDDTEVSVCPFCHQKFSNYTFRRHHCRLCGRVVCGDPLSGCSSEVGLDVAISPNTLSEKLLPQVQVHVRMCRECNKILFRRRDFAEELARKPPDLRSYETLVQFERGIRSMLPKFQSLLMMLQYGVQSIERKVVRRPDRLGDRDPNTPPTPSQLVEASKVRRRLMDAFAQYDVAARRIRDLPTDSTAQRRLQRAVYQQATNFLHLHMLPLKTLPKLLKHAGPDGKIDGRHASSSSLPSSLTGHGRSESRALASKGYHTNSHHHLDPATIHVTGISSNQASDISTGNSIMTHISAMEAEERQLRERLIVLEEQRFLVDEMLSSARKGRRFDDITALVQNRHDLNAEIDGINATLGRLDFASAYDQADLLSTVVPASSSSTSSSSTSSHPPPPHPPPPSATATAATPAPAVILPSGGGSGI